MTVPQIFDRGELLKKRSRIYQSSEPCDFLWAWVGQQITDRLAEIKRTFPTALEIGTHTPHNIQTEWKNISSIETLFQMDLVSQGVRRNTFLIGDEEYLPFGPQTLDLALSNLTLHSVNDLPGTLIQIRSALKADGFFCAALFGGETLWQLKEAISQTELSRKNGLSPRIFPFADKQQMGSLMQRAGFALPVIDSDILTVTYPDIYKLMHDLRGMGESNIIQQRDKSYPGRHFFDDIQTYYAQHFSDKDHLLEAHFEIIFITGWAPHSSQQKPLRPGSAKNRLADALNTSEIGTGEKT